MLILAVVPGAPGQKPEAHLPLRRIIRIPGIPIVLAVIFVWMLGHNTIYVIEVEGMRFAHLGDLGHDLSEDHAEALEGVDILFISAGGGNVLAPDAAAELAARIGPKVVIPMQFRTATGDQALEPVDAFCKQVGTDVPEPVSKITIRPADLGDTMQVIVLDPESESSGR